MEIVPKVNITNCYPPNKFKVIAVPKEWRVDKFPYLNRVGKCVGAYRGYGARLEFDTKEVVTIPFEVLEAVDSTTPTPGEVTPTQALPVVAQEVELTKGNYYKLIRKPTTWNEAKYVGETGKCILVDDRGARLRFSDGNDISFQADVLEVAPPIDLSNVIPQGELDEKDIITGGLYFIKKAPEKFGKGNQLIGKVGKAKWTNYRGVCLKFVDGSSYVIPCDCIARHVAPVTPNPIPVAVLSASSIIIGRKYKVKSVPGDWKENEKRYGIGQFAEAIAATDITKQARIKFDNKLEKMIPFDCLEELPRPTQDELIALIKQHPDKLLNIIKQINSVTKLKPVMDFCSSGLLPYCKEEAVTIIQQEPQQVQGPQLPVQHSTALLNNSVALMGTTVGEASDDMLNRVVSLFHAEEAAEN